MSDYTAVRDKIGVQVSEQLRAFRYWFGVAVSVLLLSGLITATTGSQLVWFIGLTVSVCAWLLDVSHRQLTFDSWRPHSLFWGSMAIVTLLSGGVAGFITIPGYILEWKIS